MGGGEADFTTRALPPEDDSGFLRPSLILLRSKLKGDIPEKIHL